METEANKTLKALLNPSFDKWVLIGQKGDAFILESSSRNLIEIVGLTESARVKARCDFIDAITQSKRKEQDRLRAEAQKELSPGEKEAAEELLQKLNEEVKNELQRSSDDPHEQGS